MSRRTSERTALDSNELEMCLKEMNIEKVKSELVKENCARVEFKFNVRKGSHMVGIWERQIRPVRNVLNVFLYQNGSQLYDESLVTFMCEAEMMVRVVLLQSTIYPNPIAVKY